MTQPNLGRYGAVGFAVQTAVGTPANPTVWLRPTGFANPEITVTRTRDNYANRSIFQQQERPQGRRWDGRAIPFEAELSSLRELMKVFNTPVAGTGQTVTVGAGGAAAAATSLPVTALTAALPANTILMFGGTPVFVTTQAAQGATTLTVSPLVAPVAAAATATLGASSTVTPRIGNFAALAPNTPITVEQLHPAVNLRASDVQVSALSLSVANRTNVTGSVTLNGTRVTDSFSPQTPVLPVTDVLQYQHHYLRFGSTIFRPETSGLTLTTPMDLQDGANGLDPTNAPFGLGYERTDAVSLSAQFSIPSYDTALRDAFRNGTTDSFAYGFLVGSKVFEFRMRAAEVNSVEIPGGLDRIVVPYTVTAVQTDGLAPWSIYSV